MINIYAHLRPLKTQHGPDRSTLRWWQVVPFLCSLSWNNYRVMNRGWRLWIYTRWGGIHFDIWHSWIDPGLVLIGGPKIIQQICVHDRPLGINSPLS